MKPASDLEIMSALLASSSKLSADALSARLRLTESSLYRRISHLIAGGLMRRKKRGLYAPHPALVALLDGYSLRQTLSDIGRPILEALSHRCRRVTHLGLFEDDMVTYLIKAGGAHGRVHTEEEGQLEAYASAIGKVLLSSRRRKEIEAYLADGPFPKLTPYTITDPGELSVELETVRQTQVAFDRCEFAPDLFCVARPVMSCRGEVVGAISISTAYSKLTDGSFRKLLVALDQSARELSEQLGGGLPLLTELAEKQPWKRSSV